jgi:hypothetical protein
MELRIVAHLRSHLLLVRGDTPTSNWALLEPPTTLAETFTVPRLLGFHVQLAIVEDEGTMTHPGICFPLTKKRTLPSDESVA